jgi:hypothetical protein
VTPAPSSTSLPAAGSPLVEHEVAGAARHARVLAAFPTALYLQLGRHDLVLPVLTRDALLLPTGLRLALPSGTVRWGVQPGDEVLVGNGRVRLPGRDVVSVRLWRPARVTPGRPGAGSITAAADRLGRADSSAVLRELAADLTAAALGGRPVSRRVGVLVGAGAGLTPSGDDALCGVLLALRAVGGLLPAGPGAARAVAGAVREASTATTSLSASLLSAASEGYAVPEVVRLVSAVASGDDIAVAHALDPVLRIGHSSGADLVAGVSGALDVLARLADAADLPGIRAHDSTSLHAAPAESPPTESPDTESPDTEFPDTEPEGARRA